MTTKEIIINENELIKTIDTLNLKNSKIALIGGHYLLLYEKKTDSLKPAIYQEFEDWGNKTFSKKMTQNFPLKSFEMTVKLYLHFTYKAIDSKCVLLVNDDSFLRKDFRNEEHYESIKDKGFELRKKYFSSNNNIPATFKKVLNSFRINFVDFFAKFESGYTTSESLMPNETIFVSERRLCKSFKKTVKTAETKEKIDRLFKIINIDQSEPDNINELTVESNKINTLCLIDKGVCNCGGKTFQFFYDLINKGYDTIIFFVPLECMNQVVDGTGLICHSKEFEEKKINIINIAKIESNPDDNIVEKEIVITHNTNQSKIDKARQ